MLKPEEKLRRVNQKSEHIFEIPKQNTYFYFFLLCKKNWFFFTLMKLMKFLIVVFHDIGKKMFPDSISSVSADLHSSILTTVK